MASIEPYLITKLYTWTVKDVNQIFDSCFLWNHEHSRYEGPSSTFSIMLAALIDTWGSIVRDRFGKDESDENVSKMLSILYANNPNDYKIHDSSGKNESKLVAAFRHNLIHNFGKRRGRKEFDLNIDTTGQAINLQKDGRWHVNCRKLKNDFLNALRLQLPKLLSR